MERSPDWVQFILDRSHGPRARRGVRLQQRRPACPVGDPVEGHGTERARVRPGKAVRAARYRGRALAPRPAGRVRRRRRPLSAAARHGEAGPALARRRCLEGRAPDGARLDRHGEARFRRDGPGSSAALRQPLLVGACEGRLPGRGLRSPAHRGHARPRCRRRLHRRQARQHRHGHTQHAKIHALGGARPAEGSGQVGRSAASGSGSPRSAGRQDEGGGPGSPNAERAAVAARRGDLGQGLSPAAQPDGVQHASP